ncbi:MAG: histidine kinase [Ignavibacteriales bacterium]|nr:histidine kinase [Ignavibacteriales bacterium]
MQIRSLFLFLLISTNLFSQINTETKRTLDSLQGTFSKQINQKDSVNACSTSYEIAKLYDDNSEQAKCISELKKSLSLAKAIKDYMMIGRVSNYLASIYSEKGSCDEAIKLYNQSYLAFEKQDAKPKMAAILMNIGTEYVSLGNFKKAIELELKAIDLKVQSKDSTNIAYYYLSLAELYFSVKDFPKWEEYLLFAEKLSRDANLTSVSTQIQILNELGEYHRRKGEISKAINGFKEMYNLSKKEEYENGMAVALSNLVPIYISKGDFRNATEASGKSLELARAGNKVSSIIYNLIQLGTLNRNLGKNVEAQKYLLEGLNLAGKHGSAEKRIMALEELYRVNKNLGNSSSALNYYEMYTAGRDSILDLETKKEIAEIGTKYETEKKESQILILNNQNELNKNELSRQRILIIGVISVTLLLAAVGFLIYNNKKTKAELLTVQAEHKMLRSQMNPHFIFNSLMAIQNFLFKNDAAKTADYLSDFASLTRMILASSRSDKISLEDEIEISENYLRLQKLRFNNKFEYAIRISEDIDRKQTFIPPMLIQPFIENAVEHGVRPLEGSEGKIQVTFEKNAEGLIVSVTDNGNGISKSQDDKRGEHVSYATEITKERISTIEKIYKAKIKMEILDLGSEQGTLVKFEFPNSLTKMEQN